MRDDAQVRIDDQERARRHPTDAAEDGLLATRELVLQEAAQGGWIDPRLPWKDRQQRLDLGGKGDSIGETDIEERLDPETIAPEDQTTGHGIMQREGEHAMERAETLQPIGGVGE